MWNTCNRTSSVLTFCVYSQKIQASAAAAAEEEGDEEEVDEYKVDIELVDELKEILEHECEQIKTHKKVIYVILIIVYR